MSISSSALGERVPIGPAPIASSGATSAGPMTVSPCPSKKRITPRSTPSSPPDAMMRRIGWDCPHQAEIRLQLRHIRPGDTANDHEMGATVLAEGPRHTADLAPVDTRHRQTGKGCIDFAIYADDMHLPTACNCRFGDLLGNASASSQEAKANDGAGAHSSGAARGVQSERLPPARMNSTISTTIGCPENSDDTSVTRSAIVPSAANIRR